MKRGLTSLFLLLPGLLLGQPLVTAQVEQQPGSQVIGLAGTPSESAILSLSGMSYWVAGQETDSQNLTQLGSSGAGDAQFGSTSGADSNDPTALPWYSTSDYDVTVDGVNYKYLSDNLVTNGDFENWTGGAPNGWTETEAGSTTLNQETSDVASGSSALRMDIDGSNNAGQIVQNGIFKANTLYYYSLSAKCEAGGSYAQLRIGSDADVLILTTSYQTFTGFQYSGATTGLDIRRNGTASNLSIYFDNVVVREVTANLGDHVYLPGTSGNYLSHPDSAAVSVTGSIDARWEVALDDYANGSVQTIGGKWVLTGNQRSWLVQINATGAPIFYISDDGSGTGAGPFTFSTTIPTSDGVKVHFRFTYDTATTTARFYTSLDGSSWSQLGSDQTGCAKTAIYDGTAGLEIGSFNGGIGDPTSGKFYSDELWNGIEGSGGTLVQNWRASSMTQGGGSDEQSGGTWTINRSASGLKSTLVTRPVIVFDSAASTYLTVADHDDLDMGASDDFTVWVYGRSHDGPASAQTFIGKKNAQGNASAGYALSRYTTDMWNRIGDGTVLVSDLEPITDSASTLWSLLRDTTADTVTGASNGTLGGTPVTDTTTATLSNASTLRTGLDHGGSSPAHYELFAAGVLKGTALTATQLAILKTELDTLLGGRTGE